MNMPIEQKVLPINNNFVYKGIREINSGNGNGESRLHIGSRTTKEEVESFFNNFDDNSQYYFVRANLKEYMYTVKFEYIYQGFQKYKNISKEYWQEQFDQLNSIDNFNFTYKTHRIDSNGKMYCSFKGDIFNFIRRIALPGITDLIIEKINSKYKFLLKFREDITDQEIHMPHIPDMVFDFSQDHNDTEEEERMEEEIIGNYFICKLNQSMYLGKKVSLPILKKSIDYEINEGDVLWICTVENNETFLASAGIIEEISESEDKLFINVTIKKEVSPINIDNLRSKGILMMELPLLLDATIHEENKDNFVTEEVNELDDEPIDTEEQLRIFDE